MDRYGSSAAPPRPPKLLPPRVHRPAPAPLPNMSSPPSHAHAPITAPLTPLSLASRRRLPAPPALQLHPQPPQGRSVAALESPVTLTAPRPDLERSVNEYVDAPFRPGQPPKAAPRSAHLPEQVGATASTHSQGRARVPAVRPTALPVTEQPLSFVKKHGGAGGGGVGLHCEESADGEGSAAAVAATGGPRLARGSIICQMCGGCRCEQCQAPRPLPSRWVCDNNCLCSAETVIDYATCLCCVKALYYHVAKDHELERDGDGTSCADDPCSCLPHRRIGRWGCMAALSLALPCLWCYWPLRGCEAMCAAAYAHHARDGCRCQGAHAHNRPAKGPKSRPAELTPEKRLLDSSPEY